MPPLSHRSESYSESYFVLPVKKQPTIKLPRSVLMTGALTLIAILFMVVVGLSLGLWWDSLSPLR